MSEHTFKTIFTSSLHDVGHDFEAPALPDGAVGAFDPVQSGVSQDGAKVVVVWRGVVRIDHDTEAPPAA